MEILKEIPRAVLWLVDDNPTTTANIRKQAMLAHADVSRILFTGRSAHVEYKAKLKLADVFLDNFPYNCGSTTNDAINAGLPLVTRSGKTLVSRMGKSVLSNIGASELIAETNDQYIQTCILLSKDPKFCEMIRKKLTINKVTSRNGMQIPLASICSK
jgi:predicted O-linked N-acetylglucosamine transferase (SPINDLY family)